MMNKQNKDNPQWRTALKYIGLTIAGAVLFGVGSVYAYAERGYWAIGGEVFSLFTPLIYWMILQTIRDVFNLFVNEPELEADCRKGRKNIWLTSKHGTDAHVEHVTKHSKRLSSVQPVTSAPSNGQSETGAGKRQSEYGTTQLRNLLVEQNGHYGKQN